MEQPGFACSYAAADLVKTSPASPYGYAAADLTK